MIDDAPTPPTKLSVAKNVLGQTFKKAISNLDAAFGSAGVSGGSMGFSVNLPNINDAAGTGQTPPERAPSEDPSKPTDTPPVLEKASAPAVRIDGENVVKSLEQIHHSIIDYLGVIESNQAKEFGYLGKKIKGLDATVTQVSKKTDLLSRKQEAYVSRMDREIREIKNNFLLYKKKSSLTDDDGRQDNGASIYHQKSDGPKSSLLAEIEGGAFGSIATKLLGPLIVPALVAAGAAGMGALIAALSDYYGGSPKDKDSKKYFDEQYGKESFASKFWQWNLQQRRKEEEAGLGPKTDRNTPTVPQTKTPESAASALWDYLFGGNKDGTKVAPSPGSIPQITIPMRRQNQSQAPGSGNKPFNPQSADPKAGGGKPLAALAPGLQAFQALFGGNKAKAHTAIGGGQSLTVQNGQVVGDYYGPSDAAISGHDLIASMRAITGNMDGRKSGGGGDNTATGGPTTTSGGGSTSSAAPGRGGAADNDAVKSIPGETITVSGITKSTAGTQPVDAVSLYNAAYKSIPSSLVGFVPPDGAKYGIKTGSREEWARLTVAMAKQESGMRANPPPENAAHHGTAGLFQFDTEDLRRRGLGNTKDDVRDPNKQLQATLKEFQKIKTSGSIAAGLGGRHGYFGPVNRGGGEYIRHLGYAANVEKQAQEYNRTHPEGVDATSVDKPSATGGPNQPTQPPQPNKNPGYTLAPKGAAAMAPYGITADGNVLTVPADKQSYLKGVLSPENWNALQQTGKLDLGKVSDAEYEKFKLVPMVGPAASPYLHRAGPSTTKVNEGPPPSANKTAEHFQPADATAVQPRNKNGLPDIGIVDYTKQSGLHTHGAFKGDGPIGFTIHHTGGNYGSRGPAGVSDVLRKRGLGVQYFIDKKGKIYQLTADNQIDWHAKGGGGTAGPRYAGLGGTNTIGVEVEGEGAGDITEAQHEATRRLGGYLKQKYPSIQLENVRGHGEIQRDKEKDEGLLDAKYIREHGFDPLTDQPQPPPNATAVQPNNQPVSSGASYGLGSWEKSVGSRGVLTDDKAGVHRMTPIGPQGGWAGPGAGFNFGGKGSGGGGGPYAGVGRDPSHFGTLQDWIHQGAPGYNMSGRGGAKSFAEATAPAKQTWSEWLFGKKAATTQADKTIGDASGAFGTGPEATAYQSIISKPQHFTVNDIAKLRGMDIGDPGGAFGTGPEASAYKEITARPKPPIPHGSIAEAANTIKQAGAATPKAVKTEKQAPINVPTPGFQSTKDFKEEHKSDNKFTPRKDQGVWFSRRNIGTLTGNPWTNYRLRLEIEGADRTTTPTALGYVPPKG